MAWLKRRSKYARERSGEAKRLRAYNAHREIYNSRQYKDMRRTVLFTEPLCRPCEERGVETLATEVDHIVPLSQDSSKAYDYSNLQPICRRCHRSKTGREVMEARKRAKDSE